MLVALSLVTEHAESECTLFGLDRAPDPGRQGIGPQSTQGAPDACGAQNPASAFGCPGDLQARLVVRHSAPIIAAIQRQVAEAVQRMPYQARKRRARKPCRIREQPLTLVVRGLITCGAGEQVQCRRSSRVVSDRFEQRQSLAVKADCHFQICTLARDPADAVSRKATRCVFPSSRWRARLCV